MRAATMSTLTSDPAEAPGSEPVRTVLVVEDDILIRMALAEYLRDCGLRVIEAGNGAEAVRVLTQSDVAIDLVFSDVQMPEMDGFGLAQWVHANRPGLPIILTSGNDLMAQKAHDVCTDGPLEKKPYDYSLLFQRLKATLARVSGLAAEPDGPAPGAAPV